MKIKENVTVYGCDFCKKKMFVKWAMEKHIEFCYYNPKNFKRCSDCKYLEETQVEFTTDYCGQENIRTAKTFRCKKLDQLLYPLKVERLGLADKHPETFEDQKPMPKECEHFKSHWENDYSNELNDFLNL